MSLNYILNRVPANQKNAIGTIIRQFFWDLENNVQNNEYDEVLYAHIDKIRTKQVRFILNR